MSKYAIISRNGVEIRYSGTPTFTGTYMKPGMLEFREVSSPTPIEWAPGDFAVYSRMGGRIYRLYNVPQVKKQSRSNTYGGAFVYQSVQLFDDSKMLEYCPFKDLVKGDTRIHFSTQPSISTFEGVDGLARRFQACLEDMYGSGSWVVRVATSTDGASQELIDLMAEPRDYTVSGVNMLEALDKVYEIWPDVGWIYTIEGGVNTIVIGGAGLNASSREYAYGKGNGLKSITRTAANADELANRIFAYGSSRNMLPRWYNNQNIKDAESVDIQNLMLPVDAIPSMNWNGWGLTDGERDAAKAYVEDDTSIARLGLRPTTVYFDGSGEYPEIYPSIRETTIKMVRRALGSSSAQYYPSTSIYTNENARVDTILSAPASFDSGLTGDEGKSALVSTSEVLGALSGNGSVSPGLNTSVVLASRSYTMTKTSTTDISVTMSGSGSIATQGGNGAVHLAISIQKGDGTTFNEVKRQLFELTPNENNAFTFRTVFAKATDVPVTIGEVVRVYLSIVIANTSGDSSLSYAYSLSSAGINFSAALSRKKAFSISIRQVGFDIGAQAALGDGKTIAMRTGKCAGRSFAINSAQYDSATDSWVLECFRSEDESLSQWFPNTDYPVEAGDEFVLLDIAMPEIYVTMAEGRLLNAAQELLSDTSIERWQYTPDIDAKYMIENERIISAGEYMALLDTDLIGESATNVLVDTITINEGEAQIPTYKVTLRDRKRKTWTESAQPEGISSKPVSNQTQESLSSSQGSESYFTLDDNGNVTLKSQYTNLWVPGWLAAGGVGTGGGGGGGGLISTVYTWTQLQAMSSAPTDDTSSAVNARGVYEIYQAIKNTYNKSQVDSLIGAINSFEYVVAATLPTAGVSTMYKIYLIPSTDPQTLNVKDEYITIFDGSSYSWELIGSTAIDITGKADKVVNATSGNLAALDSNGNLVDSGHKHGDYVTIEGTQNISGIKRFDNTTTFNGSIYVGPGIAYPGCNIQAKDQYGLKITSEDAYDGNTYLLYKSGKLGVNMTPTNTVDISGTLGVSGASILAGNVAQASSNPNWSITSGGNATFDSVNTGWLFASALSVNGTEVTPSNYVTINGNEEISGSKTFTSGTLTIKTATGGTPTLVFQRGTLSDAYVDWKIQSNSGNLNFIYRASGGDSGKVTFSNTAVRPHNGSVSNNVSNISLGLSTAQWGGLYSSTGDFSSNVSVGGNISVTGGAYVDEIVDRLGNGLLVGAEDSDSWVLLRSETRLCGCDLVGYDTQEHGVDTEDDTGLTWTIKPNGNASFASIDIGPARIEYANGAIHITTNVTTGTIPVIGLYADGFVAAGGVGSGSGSSGTLHDLTDVQINDSTLANGDLLKYDGTHWVNVPQSQIVPTITESDPYFQDFLENGGTIEGTIYGGVGGDVYWEIDNDGTAVFDSISVNGGVSSAFLKADGSLDTNSYALASAIPTESTVSGWGFTKNEGTVTSITVKAGTGISISNGSTAITTFGTRTVALATVSGLTTGTYKSVTVDSYGRVTAGTNPTTLSGYGITDAKIESGVITLGSNTITPLTSHQTVTLASGTNNGTLKITTAAGTTDNVAVTGLGTLAYKSSLVASDIPDVSSTYVTVGTAQTITGTKKFTASPALIGANLIIKDANDTTEYGKIKAGSNYLEFDVGSSNKYMLYNTSSGFFYNGGGVNCGASDHRWSNVYSVAANLSGALTAASASLSGSLTAQSVVIGSATLAYDINAKALYVSGMDGGTTVGFYCNGFVAAGGVATSSGGGGGSTVAWGTESGNTVALSVDGISKTLILSSAKVTSISSSSTDNQIPSAKCVYDIVGDVETLLAAL